MRLREHQVDAVAAVRTDAARQQVIMACGTGKTLTGQHAVAKLLGESVSGTVLVLVPTLMLLEQTYLSWIANAPFGFDAIGVCSKLSAQDQVDVGAEGDIDPGDLSLAATTEPAVLAGFLDGAGSGVRVVFGTYQSLGVVIDAHHNYGSEPWSVVLCDEAHRTAGEKTKPFARVLHDECVPAGRRLFMTATPRVHKVLDSEPVRPSAAVTPRMVASMDNDQLYGPAVFVLSVAEAIAADILSDYQVAVIGVEDHELHTAAEVMAQVMVAGRQVSLDHVAAIVALSKAAQQYGLRSVIAFFNRIAASKSFVAAFNAVHGALSSGHLAAGTAEHIDGTMTLDARDAALARLAADHHDGFHLVSNARCLSEGIDVPVLDAVLFGEPRASQIEVVQCVGRAIRKNPRHDNPALIVLAVRIGAGEDAEEAIEEQQFKKIRQVIAALADHDPRIFDAVRALVRCRGPRPGRPGAEELAQAQRLLRLDVPAAQLDGGFALRVLDRADQGWETGYDELRAFTDSCGHARVPTSYITATGFTLGSWVSTRRTEYRSAWLTASRVANLEALPGWTWNIADEQWETGIAELRAFAADHGHAQVPGGFVTASGHRLGTWVKTRRKDYRAGALNADRAAELAEMPGWTWNARDKRWDVGIGELRAFVAEHGHARVPQSFTTLAGHRLGAWVGAKRNQYRAGKLSADRVAVLEALHGWTWNASDEQWDAAIGELRAFVAKHGHARVPQSFTTASGHRLGDWVITRRSDYRRDKLDADRAAELAEMPGWTWSARDEQWDARIGELRAFVAEHGHARVPSGFTTARGYNLGSWVKTKRREYLAGALNADRAAELAEMPGWAWSARDRRLNAGIGELRAFVAEHGHARVPQSFTTLAGHRLGAWVGTKRGQYREGTLNADLVAELEALPEWIWNVRDEQWDAAIGELRAFVTEHGHARVPGSFITASGHRLGDWVTERRSDYRADKLNRDRAAELEALPGWAWNVLAEQWDAGVAELRAFIAEHGHACVPFDFVAVSGHNLGAWVTNRRTEYRSGILNVDRAGALEALPGWAWNSRDQRWDTAISELRAFVTEHGRARVPATFVSAGGHRLGQWVQERRKDYRSGKLKTERAAELEGLPGWVWRA